MAKNKFVFYTWKLSCKYFKIRQDNCHYSPSKVGFVQKNHTSMMTYLLSLMTSVEITFAKYSQWDFPFWCNIAQWIVYINPNDRSIIYLVCLIYTSKWFRVWLTSAKLEVRGCFDVLISKGSEIQDDLGAKSTQRRLRSYRLFEAVCQTHHAWSV